MSDAWFLEPIGTEVRGSATVEWLGDAFLFVLATLDGELNLAMGRSDSRDAGGVAAEDQSSPRLRPSALSKPPRSPRNR